MFPVIFTSGARGGGADHGQSLTVPGLVKSTLCARLCRTWLLKRRAQTLCRYSGVICKEGARMGVVRGAAGPGWGAPACKLPLRGSLPRAEAKLTLSSELSGFQALSPTEKTAPVTPGLMVGIAL